MAKSSAGSTMADAQLVENEDGSWLLQGELGFASVLSVLRHDGVGRGIHCGVTERNIKIG